MSLRHAVDIFFVLTRAEPYYDLTVRRGWSQARAKKWQTALLAHQLLAEL